MLLKEMLHQTVSFICEQSNDNKINNLFSRDRTACTIKYLDNIQPFTHVGVDLYPDDN